MIACITTEKRLSRGHYVPANYRKISLGLGVLDFSGCGSLDLEEICSFHKRKCFVFQLSQTYCDAVNISAFQY